jgi:hypothetical protein
MGQASTTPSVIRTYTDPDLWFLRTVRIERSRSIPNSTFHADTDFPFSNFANPS